MPATALAHFKEDIDRARAIVTHADKMPCSTSLEERLRSDILRSAWMFCVGALDAYFCDAYTDVIAATISSKSRFPTMELPNFFYEVQFPIRAILEPYASNTNWRWRMAARKMMERRTVLSLDEIQKLFNNFVRVKHRFFQDVIKDWIVHPDATSLLFGITAAAFVKLKEQDRDKAIIAAKLRLEERFARVFQRRHDCIHNCDRPRVAPQPLVKSAAVVRVVEDVEFLVFRCDEHIKVEIRRFLLDQKCPSAIVSQAGY